MPFTSKKASFICMSWAVRYDARHQPLHSLSQKVSNIRPLDLNQTPEVDLCETWADLDWPDETLADLDWPDEEGVDALLVQKAVLESCPVRLEGVALGGQEVASLLADVHTSKGV